MQMFFLFASLLTFSFSSPKAFAQQSPLRDVQTVTFFRPGATFHAKDMEWAPGKIEVTNLKTETTGKIVEGSLVKISALLETDGVKKILEKEVLIVRGRASIYLVSSYEKDKRGCGRESYKDLVLEFAIGSSGEDVKIDRVSATYDVTEDHCHIDFANQAEIVYESR